LTPADQFSADDQPSLLRQWEATLSVFAFVFYLSTEMIPLQELFPMFTGKIRFSSLKRKEEKEGKEGQTML
jgi:hypothetical protein